LGLSRLAKACLMWDDQLKEGKWGKEREEREIERERRAAS
jgi:hypothetical protein